MDLNVLADLTKYSFIADAACISDLLPNKRKEYGAARMPTNGEWYASVYGPSCGTTKSRATIYRYANSQGYKGPQDRCCLNPGTKVQDGKTCDPKYRAGPSNTGCDAFYYGWCGTNSDDPNVYSRVAKDSRCRTWAARKPSSALVAEKKFVAAFPMDSFSLSWANRDQANKAFHEQAMYEYATASKLGTDAEVREWCRSNRGACSISNVLAYCQSSGLDDQFCACVNSPTKKALDAMGYTFPTECVDSKCYDYGYKSNKTQSPCQITNCSMLVDISKVGGDTTLFDNKFIQSCNTKFQQEEEARIKAEQDAAMQASEEERNRIEAEARARAAAATAAAAAAAARTGGTTDTVGWDSGDAYKDTDIRTTTLLPSADDQKAKMILFFVITLAAGAALVGGMIYIKRRTRRRSEL